MELQWQHYTELTRFLGAVREQLVVVVVVVQAEWQRTTARYVRLVAGLLQEVGNPLSVRR